MSKSLNTLIASLLLAGTAHAVAASSIDLSVKGSITPSACTPSLSNNGTVDYGKLSAKDLNTDASTRLPPKFLEFNVDCDAATLYALKGNDNRAGSAFDSAPNNFGLGLINGDEKLGSFYLKFDSAIADDVPSRFITSYDGGKTWYPGPGGSLWVGAAVAVAYRSISPMRAKVLTGKVEVTSFIAPTNRLTLTEEVPIDGSVALTVMYL